MSDHPVYVDGRLTTRARLERERIERVLRDVESDLAVIEIDIARRAEQIESLRRLFVEKAARSPRPGAWMWAIRILDDKKNEFVYRGIS
jgi:hypothetical protein